MSIQALNPSRSLPGWLAIVVIGIAVGVATVIALTLVRPVLLAFALAGFVILIPTLFVRDQRAYWLFLLVLSIPFDISKRTTTWLVDPWTVLLDKGLPISGTLSLDIYLTDAILFAMLLPWIVRLCMRKETFYFPKVGYLFVLYLAWALIVLLCQEGRVFLAMFEWCREVLYFISFIYIINNVVTHSQFRAVVAALVIGLTIGTGAVIALSYLKIGLGTNILSGIYSDKKVSADLLKEQPGAEAYAEGKYHDKENKRSSGLFEAPALAAYHLEFNLPIALGLLMAATGARERLLFGGLYAAGTIALYLTYSRSGLAGFLFALPVFFFAAKWSGLVSRTLFRRSVLLFFVLAVLATPFVVWSVQARIETISYRLGLLKDSFDTYSERPVLGAGFGGVMEGAREVARGGQTQIVLRGFHNYYLALLTEVGPIGFLLYFSFFWQVVKIAFRAMKTAPDEMKLLLVGMVGALASISVHNLGDGFGRHVTHATLWLFVGLIIAIARRVQTEDAIPATAVAIRAAA